MKLDGKETTLQAGDVVRFDKKAASIVITRGTQTMTFDGDNKFYFGGHLGEDRFMRLVRFLAQTHGFGMSMMNRYAPSGDPYYLLLAE